METKAAPNARLSNRSRVGAVRLRLVRAERAPQRFNRPCCPYEWIVDLRNEVCPLDGIEDLMWLSRGSLKSCHVDRACSGINFRAFGERCIILRRDLQKHGKHLQVGREFSNAPRQPGDHGCAHLDGRVSGHQKSKRDTARPGATHFPLVRRTIRPGTRGPPRLISRPAEDQLRNSPSYPLIMTNSGDRNARNDHGPALRAYLHDLASSAPVPGGGSAAAISAAHAAALVAMVGRLTVGREAFSEFENETAPALAEADDLVGALHVQITADEAAFDAVMGAYRQPRDTPEARRSRRQAIAEASRLATIPPMEVARRARRVVDLAVVMARYGNPMVISDAAVAAWSAVAAIRASIMNVRVNLGATNDPHYSSACESEIANLLSNADQLASDIDALVLSRIGYAAVTA